MMLRDDDTLTMTDVMRAANVWSGVLMKYEKDLLAEMLRVKGTPGPYRKSTDWPEAWTAVDNTRHLYERRVLDTVNELKSMSSSTIPECVFAEMARSAVCGLKTPIVLASL